MDHEEIVGPVVRLLQQHQQGFRGTIHQEPCKGDFFKLFAAAFNAGLIDRPSQRDYLSADALGDVIAARAPEVADGETWYALHTLWQEWTYAWRQRSLVSPR